MSDSDKDKAELKRLTREAHEAIQDLNGVLREARQMVTAIDNVAQVAVTQRLEPVVEEQIRLLSEATATAIAASEQGIYDRFDTLTQMMMGEDRKSIREGRPTIPQMAENIGALRRGEEPPHDLDFP